jgi:MFS family permease
MGVYSVLLSVFFAMAFVYIGAVVRDSGWRSAWSQVAFALVVFVAPLVLVFLKEPAVRRPSSEEPSASVGGLSLGEALGTPAFWVFAGATSLFGLVSSGLGLFNEAVLAERGFTAETYHTFLAATAVIALAGQLVCGWLSVRWSMQRLLAMAMVIYAAALGALPLLTSLPQLWIFAVLIGFSGGMITVIFFAVWRAFGSAHLGRIQGAAQMLTVVASALGPLIFAECARWTGSYALALWTLAPCVLLIGAASLKVSLPTARRAPFD